ncbi:MAG: sulfur carrier protein ThiS [Anaerovoracaceae bacterium]
MVTINGQKYQLADGIKVSEYLETEGIDKGTIAIELNGEILPKSRYEETVLSDGDKIEIVNFVGGG